MAVAPTAGGAPVGNEARDATSLQPWPAPRTAWYALGVFAVALMFAQLDRSIFAMMIEYVKRDFALSDIQIGLLLGPASVLFYVFVGIPMARLVDIYPRNIVLSAGIVVWSGITAVSGLVQSYGQLFLCRMLVGVGGSAHGPGTYSMMADYFPPKKLPRAIAGLQVGFIAGIGLSAMLGGWLVTIAAGWPPSQFMGLTIRGWQWVLIIVGLPGLLVAALVRALPEPPRRNVVADGQILPIGGVLKEIHARRAVYYPLMIGLGLSSLEAGGLAEWRVAFMARTYGWNPMQVGAWSALGVFVAMPLGLVLGTWLTERFARRFRDAPVRTTVVVLVLGTPFTILSSLMPTGELSMIVGSVALAFGMAGSVPQNAAIQTVTPNEMRGQVTAVYLFMFTVFQALGSFLIAAVTTYVVGDESKLWLSMTITAAVLMPAAAVTIASGMRPYAREIERLEGLR